MSTSPLAALPDLENDVEVSVVIPALRAAASLESAVNSALAQRPPVAEIVIAAGDPATSTVAHRLAELHTSDTCAGDAGGDAGTVGPDGPVITVVGNPQGGTSTALNAAIAASRGEVIVRLDAHARLPAGYVERAVASLRQTGAANVGGRQVPTATKGFARAVALAMRSPWGSGGAAYRNGQSAGPADTVYLGVFRRSALQAVGGFDERFVRNQDAELNERLRQNGYVVWFDPLLEVDYRPRSTVAALAVQYFQYGRWRRATARRHRGSLKLRQVAAPVVVIALVACAVVTAVTGWAWVAAVGFGGYALGLVAAGWHAARRPLIGLAASLALATMHLAWGLGFLLGPGRAVRAFGPTGDAEQAKQA